MRITLSVTAGPHLDERFEFTEHSTFLVGRSRQAHFRLKSKDRHLSRVHFLVEVNPPCCRLLDMGSHNGTFVNGKQVAQADLHDGDRIRAGRTMLLLSIESEQAPAADPTAAQGVPESEAEPEGVVAPGPRDLPGVTTVAAPPANPVACPACGAPVSPADQAAGQAGDTAGTSCCPVCGTLRVAEWIPSPAGPVLPTVPGYDLLGVLGRGGMGVVYLARQRATSTAVALKTITPAQAGTPELLTRFLREAAILRELDHPHIVAFREMGQAGRLLWLVMDYVQGTDACRSLEQHGPLPAARAVGWVCQVLEALEYAHARGFVHRDIKPANLLIAAGEREVVKLADFGLARYYQESKLSGLTLTGTVGGTPGFLAPEQIVNFREAKPAADQYALAATLYNLLTGQHLYDFPREPQQRLAMILNQPPVAVRRRRAGLPDGLARVIHRALARDPAKRFAGAGEMRLALLPFCS
jgi:serine/threonine-protein kinase